VFVLAASCCRAEEPDEAMVLGHLFSVRGGWKPLLVGLAALDPPYGFSTGGESTARTGLVYSDVYLRHDTGRTPPERPQRLTAIVQRLNGLSLLREGEAPAEPATSAPLPTSTTARQEPRPPGVAQRHLETQGLLSRLVRIAPAANAEPWLTAVHTPAYVDHVRASCRDGAATLDSPDTPVSRDSYNAAVAAVGGVLAAVDAVMDGKARNAFCAIRPPGHHALKDRAMGFCLFNNVAVAARYAMAKHHLKKVLIVDWDVHHGNGTQAAFNDDPNVLYFSVHQHPFYPGTGTAGEKGKGKAIGTKINVPLPAGSGDEDYRKAFQETLRPAAIAFEPELVLVSAGFDAYEHDLLGGMKVTPRGFEDLTRIVKAIAEQCCRGRLVSVLEGGYQLDGLAACVEAHLRILSQ